MAATSSASNASAAIEGRVVTVDGVTGEVAIAAGERIVRARIPLPATLPESGDIVRLRGALGDAPVTIDVLTPYRRAVPFPSPGADYYRLHSGDPSRAARLRQRAVVLAATRRFFDQRGFIEVQTPQRVACAGLEPQLVAVESAGAHLITSPEYQMKRLLAAGLDKIYFLGSCWRGDERGPLHVGEFCLLEWYQAYAGFDALLEQTAALVRYVAQQCAEGMVVTWGEQSADLARPFERITVAQACERFCGLDIEGIEEAPELKRRAGRAGIDVSAVSDFDEVFSRILVEGVEPRLADLGAVFLTEYPTPLAALARRQPERPQVAERAELYICGVELSNGFGELTDPDEQIARLREDQRTRQARGLPVHPIDERFIEALREGIPPAVGNALGVDRLVMLLTGAETIDEVLAFSPEEI